MIGIHPIHRRLAELTHKANNRGSYDQLSTLDQLDLVHCLQANLDLIMRMDSLKSLSFLAYSLGDVPWQHEICKKIDELERKVM